uniref:MFS transporter n=1 Tax=Cupriavidus ulmosensis TaxID=3065913 RepID=UPI003F85B1EE
MSQELSGAGAALAAPAGGPWSPLRNKVFRAIWLATLASNIGTWMPPPARCGACAGGAGRCHGACSRTWTSLGAMWRRL